MNRRPRRNRKNPVIRGFNREHRLSPEQLVYPLFLVEGKKIKTEIKSLPGNFRFSPDELLNEIEECMNIGLRSFILFPAVDEEHKDKEGSYSWSSHNFYLKTIREVKKKFPEACLISDVALDPYSSDGHDGIVRNGEVLNDETLSVLAKMALAQAEAGIDIVGPSDMMDGRVGFIRKELDRNGFTDTGIMSYTAKYASALYGPFRDALDSAPKAGDKKTYQMDPANSREALIEGDLDVQEGADYLMVKPALHYLDIIHKMKENYDLPVAAYHVSGECAMLLAACNNGWLDYEKAMPETLLCLNRAGADVIITYLAKDYLKLINSKQ